ncbi:hypothetical protein [Streptomyces xiamenensis]|uniref:hypothetical protein n=1 Tax=Streptomyces xiamenensis TaxID=408015 RepID=UPI003D72DDB1
MAPIEYGLSYKADSPPSPSRRYRHVWWYEQGGSKCGKAQLVERTTDLSIPLCKSCARAMQRLARERNRRRL